MTRETKIGLLVGMGVIVLIGILVSDHLSVAQNQAGASLVGTADETQTAGAGMVLPLQRNDPIPLPSDGAARGDEPAPRYAPQPMPRRRQADPDPSAIRHRLYPANALDPSMTAGDDDDPPSDPANTVDVISLGAQQDGAPAGDAVDVVEQGPPQPERRSQPAPVERSETAAPVSTPRDRVHHVQSGQSLYSIAELYYGDGAYWRAIYEANRDRIPSPNNVRQGVRLVIPDRSGQAVVDQPEPATQRPAAPAPATTTYVVKRGDTASVLAQKFFGTARAVDRLVEMNRGTIDDPDHLTVGMRLYVPRR